MRSIEAIMSEVFPSGLPLARLRNNPPPSRDSVAFSLRLAERGADLHVLPARATFYLLNAGCIEVGFASQDGCVMRVARLTEDGRRLLDHLAASPACARCGDTGEVLVYMSDLAGNMMLDVLPCPDCSPDDDLEAALLSPPF